MITSPKDSLFEADLDFRHISSVQSFSERCPIGEPNPNRKPLYFQWYKREVLLWYSGGNVDALSILSERSQRLQTEKDLEVHLNQQVSALFQASFFDYSDEYSWKMLIDKNPRYTFVHPVSRATLLLPWVSRYILSKNYQHKYRMLLIRSLSVQY